MILQAQDRDPSQTLVSGPTSPGLMQSLFGGRTRKLICSVVISTGGMMTTTGCLTMGIQDTSGTGEEFLLTLMESSPGLMA